MMRHFFLTQEQLASPRWLQAFPDATILFSDEFLPLDLNTTILWIFAADTANISRWVDAGARVVVLNCNDNPQEAKRVIEAGASGYVHYLAVAEVLAQVAQVVQLGGLWLGADLMRQLVLATATLLKPAGTHLNLDVLTVREKAVAFAVASGKSNKEVARELAITERTVKAHLSVVFEKLQLRDRLQLVLLMSNQ